MKAKFISTEPEEFNKNIVGLIEVTQIFKQEV
jgi:hypothetical protein